MSDTLIDHYAVFGNPITHSKSPQIHTLFARQTEQNMVYTAERAIISQFERAVHDFFKKQGRGINITAPFKADAWKLADTHSERAQRAGAVNTLVLLDNGQLFGDTTDGVGLARDLILNQRISVATKNILILGAGGAVRGVLEALLEQHPAALLIANRTKLKATELMHKFAGLGNINACGLNELGKQKFDIIINGTSASLHGELPILPDNLFNADACSYDMMYAKNPTPFMQWSQQQGAKKVFDGLGMLVEQAAESFYLWRDVRPETQSVINIIRNSLAQP